MSNPGESRRDSDHVDPPACRSHRGGLQAARAPGGSAPSTRSSASASDDLAPPPYLPAGNQPGAIRDLLTGMLRYGGDPDRRPRQHHRPEAGRRGGLAGTGRAARAVRRAAGDAARDEGRDGRAFRPGARRVAGICGMGFAPLGFHPLARRADMPWMPKGRYAIMRRYMPKVGSLGLDMMTRTCTVQVNLDYASEADMVRKLRVCAAAAAAGHRVVRQFALHRGPARTASCPIAPRSGPIPTTTAPASRR